MNSIEKEIIKSLMKELIGFINLYNEDLRELAGNTNINVLLHRIEIVNSLFEEET